MLASIALRQFIIVDQLDIDLRSGFTVLTGETGAGKSLLVDALDLLLGGRAEAHVVREGAARAELSATFTLQNCPQACAWLEQAGLETAPDQGSDGPELMLRRVIDASGKSRAWINGQPATLGQLKDIGEQLVDIHGQHAHQALLRPHAQRDMLDAQAGLAHAVRSLGDIWRRRIRVTEAITESQAQAERLSAEKEQLSWIVDEIDSLRLSEGEWQTLSDEQRRLTHAADLIQTAEAALANIEDDEQSLHGQLARWSQRLSSLTAKDPSISDAAQAVESALIQMQESADALRRYLERIDLDPQRLHEVESRVEAIFLVARKLKKRPEELPAFLADTRLKLHAARQAGDVSELLREEKQLAADYDAAAREISGERRKVCEALTQSVNSWLRELGMGAMQFEAVCEPRTEAAAFGHEDVLFRLRNHPSAAAYPIHKVASGGELARISLAIAAAASSGSQVPTLIFDEVDSGIGGNVAHTVGRMLRDLGRNHQVLCVTHLPQVAARGHHHVRVEKMMHEGSAPISRLQDLDAEQRVDEIARMLGDSGAEKTSRDHARSLLSLG